MNATNHQLIGFLCGLFCVLIAFDGNSQTRKNVEPPRYTPIQVDGSPAYQDVVTSEILLDLPDSLYEVDEDWMDEITFLNDWDDVMFNPFRDMEVVFPFNILFYEDEIHPPVDRKIRVTSHFGWRWRRAHQGIDLDLETGDPVYAVMEGRVRYVDYHSGHGKTVVIRHPNGLETVYAHLSEQWVFVNDNVEKGQMIGKGGATGNARGSHLHFEVRYQGKCIHPEYLFDFTNNKIRSKNVWVTDRWTSARKHTSKLAPEVQILKSEKEALAQIAAEPKVYIVKSGDNLSRISRMFHINIQDICSINSIKISSTLRVGQRLLITP